MALPVVLAYLVTHGSIYVWKLIENGGDFKATNKELKDISKNVAFVATDTAFIPKALWTIWNSHDLNELVKAVQSFDRAYKHLPEKTRKGLENSVGMSDLVEHTLAGALSRSGASLLRTRQLTSFDDELEALYLGLFLIGRAGQRLTPAEQTDIILTLRTVHQERGKTNWSHHNDQLIDELLSIFSLERMEKLRKHLAFLPEVMTLQNLMTIEQETLVPEVIIYALRAGEKIEFSESLFDFVTKRLIKWVETEEIVD